MKKIYSIILVCSLFGAFRAGAQSFNMQHDTVSISTAGAVNVIDAVNNTTASPITLVWKVVSSNFPADWITPTGICDNNSCYPSSMLWPSMTAKTSMPYSTGLGDFHMQTDLTDVTTAGCYYMRIRLNNQTTPSDTGMATFIVCKTPTGVTSVKTSTDDVVIYPNPASNELNVVYDAGADIKSIAVYNIIGKALAVYKVTDDKSANLNLESIPAGIYFVRLINSHGQVAATKKFTKQ